MLYSLTENYMNVLSEPNILFRLTHLDLSKNRLQNLDQERVLKIAIIANMLKSPLFLGIWQNFPGFSAPCFSRIFSFNLRIR